MLRGAWAVGSLMVAVLLGSSVCPAAERRMPEPASVTALEQKVAAAVARDVGLSDENLARHVQVLDRSLSLPAGAELHVTAVRPGYSPGSWRLRIDCSSRRDCLPFHAVLHSPTASLRSDSAAGLAAPMASQPGRSTGKPKQLQPPLTHSGDHVLLVEERSGMRLQVTVVCLQSGGLGDEIRVQNPATRRILLATVAGKNLVRVE